MSRAFVKEVDPEIDDLPDRPLSTHANFVTAEGLAAIERTLNRFEAANKAAIAKNDRAAIAATQREVRYWRARRSTAKVIEPTADKSKVHFEATVTVRRDAAGRKHSASLVRMKPNPRGVPYPMSLRSLALYLVEWLAILSRFPAGARPLRKSNKERELEALILTDRWKVGT